MRVSQATPSASQIAHYAAVRNGYYRAEGFDVETVNMAPNLAAVAVGKDEMAFALATGTAIRAAMQGTPIKTVLVAQDKNAYWLVTKPEIKTVEDLKGKNVSTGVGQPNLAFKDVMAAHKLAPSDVGITINQGDAAAQVAALESGSVAGVIIPPPFNVQLKQKGMNELLFLGDVTPRQVGGGMATSIKNINEKPDFVARGIRAYLKGLRFAFENKEPTLQIISDELKISRADAAGVYDTYLKSVSKNGLEPDEGFQVVIDDQKRASNSSANVPVSEVRDFTILKRVLNELGIPENL